MSEISKKMLKFLSLKEASKISGYSQDYLGFLLRKKKIKGKKINAKLWLVEENSFFNYLARKEFVPLKKIIFFKSAILVFLFLISSFLSFFAFFNKENIIVSKETIFLEDKRLDIGKVEEQELIKNISFKR